MNLDSLIVNRDSQPGRIRLPSPVRAWHPALQTLRWMLHSPSLMDRCHARYGDVFTLSFVARAVAGRGVAHKEGKWVFLADPDHVKQVSSADPRSCAQGETNRFLLGLVGARSILVLDEPDHMTERRLLLRPLHGDRVQRYGELMARVAREEVDRWPRGEPLALWPRMQAITLDVIVRVVFGITEPARIARWRELLRTLLNAGTSPRFVITQALLASLRARPTFRGYHRLVAPVDAAIHDEIARRPSRPRPLRAPGHPLRAHAGSRRRRVPVE